MTIFYLLMCNNKKGDFMKWGTFTFVHILSLLLPIAINIFLYYLIRKRSEKQIITILFLLSVSGLIAIVYNLIKWNSVLEYLPLHLCSLNALILPIAIITKNKKLCNLLLLWSLGAMFALILNYDVSEVKIFSITFFIYYFPHVFEFGIPIILFKLKLAKKDKKCIFSTIYITLICYTIIHIINLIINQYCVNNNITNGYGNIIKVNYMFSIFPTNPLLNLMFKIIPFSYWYMYLTIPIITIYLLIIYRVKIIKIKCTSFDK